MSDLVTSVRDGIELYQRPLGSGPPSLIEIRIPKTPQRVWSGYFADVDQAVRAVEALAATLNGAANFYVTLNPVKPDCLSRAANRIKPYADDTTKDQDIARRIWLLIDCDPVRPKGVSSTDAELALALAVRDQVVEWLTEHGWPAPVLAMSGNGGHALYQIDLPNEETSTKLIQGCLKALHERFSTETVTIDQTVFNAARICKLYGTIARKGDNTPDRPHRRAEIEERPILRTVSRDQLQHLAAQRAPVAAPSARASQRGTTTRLDMRQEFEQRGWYLRELRDGWHAVLCPWIDEHSGTSGITETAIREPDTPDAWWGFKCQHDHCTGRSIRDVYGLFAPSPHLGSNTTGPAAAPVIPPSAGHTTTAPRDSNGAPQWSDANPEIACERTFTVAEDNEAFALRLLDVPITFEFDRSRRDRNGELIGQLTVRTTLIGARVHGDTLTSGTFNCSALNARVSVARKLASLSQATAIDWLRLLEEFCIRILQAERAGGPAVDLRTVPRASDDHVTMVRGMRVFTKHPTILFGDGGTAKSYLALAIGGELAQGGVSIGYADWELTEEDHRDRLERIFGPEMPRVFYIHCTRPLTAEVDRITRLVRQHSIGYLILDSLSFACDGPPEAAEVAARYFQALRQIGVGSLSIAHINKSEDADKKPFGSNFWHHGARVTWNVKVSHASPDRKQITIGCFNRKANLGPTLPAIGFTLWFDEERTEIGTVDVGTVADLAAALPLWQRMQQALRGGSKTVAELATDLGGKANSIDTAARRLTNVFTRVPGKSGTARIGLVERNPPA